jgi:NAD(P)H-binding
VVPGHDAVIITASANKLSAFKENPLYFSEGTRLVIEAMHAHGVRRLAVLSALGTGDSKHLLPFVVRLLVVSFLLKRAFQDHERQEALTRDSGLDWVIALPGRLTDAPARHEYERTTRIESIPTSISRADVAHFLVDAVDQERWVRQSVLIGG